MSKIKYATQEQVDHLLKASYGNVRDHAMLVLMYWRGLRASEVGSLSLDDYSRVESRLFVHRVKGSISAQYLLSPQEKSALDAWLKVRGTDPGPLFVSRKQTPITRQQVYRILRYWAEKAGWPPELCHPHTLRHSIAVHLVEKGIDLLAIKDWLGHRAITSTTVYAQITNRVRDEVAQRVYTARESPRVAVNWIRNKRRGRKAATAHGE